MCYCQITQCVPAVVSEAACRNREREREREEQMFPLKKRNLVHFLNSIVLFLFIKKNFSFQTFFAWNILLAWLAMLCLNATCTRGSTNPNYPSAGGQEKKKRSVSIFNVVCMCVPCLYLCLVELFLEIWVWTVIQIWHASVQMVHIEA